MTTSEVIHKALSQITEDILSLKVFSWEWHIAHQTKRELIDLENRVYQQENATQFGVRQRPRIAEY